MEYMSYKGLRLEAILCTHFGSRLSRRQARNGNSVAAGESTQLPRLPKRGMKALRRTVELGIEAANRRAKASTKGSPEAIRFCCDSVRSCFSIAPF